MSKVFFVESDDPALSQAIESARATFREFWKEVALDMNRIVPALEMAAVKAMFTDDPNDPDAHVEQMWLGDVEFDGETVRGTLLNDPNWVRSVEAGDEIDIPLNELTDWMYVLDNKVYGGYTVQIIRSQMGFFKRRGHDKAWGLKFAKPGHFFERADTSGLELGIAASLAGMLVKQPQLLNERGEGGRTYLHNESLAGRAPCVKVLIENGADVNATCARGWTPLRYAQALKWEDVAALLRAKGGVG